MKLSELPKTWRNKINEAEKTRSKNVCDSVISNEIKSVDLFSGPSGALSSIAQINAYEKDSDFSGYGVIAKVYFDNGYSSIKAVLVERTRPVVEVSYEDNSHGGSRHRFIQPKDF